MMTTAIAGVAVAETVEESTLKPGWDLFEGGSGTVSWSSTTSGELDVTFTITGAPASVAWDVGLIQTDTGDGVMLSGVDGGSFDSTGTPIGPFTREGRTVGPYNAWIFGEEFVTDGSGDGSVTLTLLGSAGDWDVQFIVLRDGTGTPSFESEDVFGTTVVVTITTAVSNEPPAVRANADSVVNEGTKAVNTGTVSDPDGDTVALTASVGAVVNNNDGTWSWSFDTDDGLAESQTVTLSADDSKGGIAETMFTLSVNNLAPTATFGDDGPVNEGTSFNLSLTSPFDPSEADTNAGFTYAFDCGDDSGLSAFGSSNSASCSTDDNALRSVEGQIKDKDGAFTEYTASVTVNNVAPTITAVTGPGVPIAIGDQPIAIGVAWTDPGTADTHDVTWNWGDASTDDTQFGATSAASEAHIYAEPGVYPVTVTVTDDDDGEDTNVFEFVVIYDPSAGFVTGGGWIDSPAGAYIADLTLTGKANFGFVSKYKKGASTPSGNTEFQFKSGDLNFRSDSYDWLVIAGSDRAKYKGVGTINGSGSYGFMLTAVDNGNSGDTFRIKIWDKDNGDAAVYDNKIDDGDDSYDGTVIGGGNIKVHKK